MNFLDFDPGAYAADVSGSDPAVLVSGPDGRWTVSSKEASTRKFRGERLDTHRLAAS